MYTHLKTCYLKPYEHNLQIKIAINLRYETKRNIPLYIIV